MNPTIAPIALAAVLALAATGAPAQDQGEHEFLNSCASCHGTSAKGDGPLAEYLSVKLPDLTQLQKNNGGVFPVTRVYQVIEGADATGPHGTREMPAWGQRYREKGAAAANTDLVGNEPEVYARFRILALIEYLASIQEQ